MTSTIPGVEHAPMALAGPVRDQIVLTGADLQAAWRLSGLSAFTARGLAAYAADLTWAGHDRAAATYAHAADIRARQSAVFCDPMQGCAPAPTWPVCELCGVDDAGYDVHCDAEMSGQLYACDACANGGDHLDSPAIAYVERHAINRRCKVRVDELDPADIELAA